VTEGRRYGFGTRAVHGARTPPVDQESPSVPIFQTATFRFASSEDYAETISFRRPGYTYTRGYGNPTLLAFERLMADLERFVNADELFAVDPLIKMALIHHQFESIHPFYDGNGRTGRIVNVLYLVRQGLLDIPVLYMSRHIVRTKSEYYRLLQAVRERDVWEDWVLYMLTAVEQTAAEGISTIQAIKALLLDVKHRIRSQFRFYSQDLINNLFSHPYTKIEFIQNDLKVSRLTATRYLDALTDAGFLVKRKVGRSNYYINDPLYRILTGDAMTATEA